MEQPKTCLIQCYFLICLFPGCQSAWFEVLTVFWKKTETLKFYHSSTSVRSTEIHRSATLPLLSVLLKICISVGPDSSIHFVCVANTFGNASYTNQTNPNQNVGLKFTLAWWINFYFNKVMEMWKFATLDWKTQTPLEIRLTLLSVLVCIKVWNYRPNSSVPQLKSKMLSSEIHCPLSEKFTHFCEVANKQRLAFIL